MFRVKQWLQCHSRIPVVPVAQLAKHSVSSVNGCVFHFQGTHTDKMHNSYAQYVTLDKKKASAKCINVTIHPSHYTLLQLYCTVLVCMLLPSHFIHSVLVSRSQVLSAKNKVVVESGEISEIGFVWWGTHTQVSRFTLHGWASSCSKTCHMHDSLWWAACVRTRVNSYPAQRTFNLSGSSCWYASAAFSLTDLWGSHQSARMRVIHESCRGHVQQGPFSI